LAGKDWDIIVPVMRKGLFVLANAPEECIKKIRLLPLYGIDNLFDKSILLIDDKAWHGHTLEAKYKELVKLGAKPGNIKTAVFVKHADCFFPVDFYYYELNDLEYQRKEADLSVYYDSQSLQLDPDHLVAKGQIITSSIDTKRYEFFPKVLEENTKDLDVFYYQESTANLWGRKKFAIADIPLSKLNIGKLASLLREDEGVQKVRFFLEPSGELYIMPIFYPGFVIDNEYCHEIFTQNESLCKQFAGKVAVTEELCRECFDFNLQVLVLKDLWRILSKRLKKSGFSLKINKLSWPELEFKYIGFEKVLERVLEELRDG
jgi:hypoxanthine phosphoribosyltransferase